MGQRIAGKSVRGASHIRINRECQDNHRIQIIGDYTVIAVADGHGSESCPYSRNGAKKAVNVFCAVMEELLTRYQGNMDMLLTYLNREGDTKVAQAIDKEWKNRVWSGHLKNKRTVPVADDGSQDKPAVYRQYGTTLLGLLVGPEFIFAFQLGDGDILLIDDDRVQPVIEGDKILGTETHSLSRMNSWEKAISMVRTRNVRQEKPYLYFMSTDGFANSYKSTEEMHKACREYYDMIREYGFDAVAKSLPEWLSETSRLGCGDDITVVLSYYEDTGVI